MNVQIIIEHGPMALLKGLRIAGQAEADIKSIEVEEIKDLPTYSVMNIKTDTEGIGGNSRNMGHIPFPEYVCKDDISKFWPDQNLSEE